MIDLARRIESHLDLNTTATLILTEEDFRSIVASLRNPAAVSTDKIADIISDYYDEDDEGRWRKCAEHIASTVTSTTFETPHD